MYAAFYPQVGGSGGMAETIQNYPEAMREALRMQDIGSAAGYLGSTVFGLLLPLLVMAFGVTFGARAVAGDEETGRGWGARSSRSPEPRPRRSSSSPPDCAKGAGLSARRAGSIRPGRGRHVLR
jgi:hypothetical protein